MKLLLLGSGGREHALAWKIAQSPKIEKLYIAPGNAGTQNVGENIAIKADDFEAIKTFVIENDIHMVVVGPEDPLVKGIYDFFKEDEALKNIPVIGPSRMGAVLEGSKEFAKEFMMRHNIPTAGYKSITADNLEEGLAFLETLEAPYVLKADGLCAGKGVLILPTLEEAKMADLILHVVDIGNSAYLSQMETVNNTLKRIGAENIPQIVVYNKADTFSGEIKLKDNEVLISAKKNVGIDVLKEKIIKKLVG